MLLIQSNFSRLLWILLFSLGGLSACSAKSVQEPAANIYDEFIERMAVKHQFDRSQLEQLLNSSKLQKSILKAMSSPAEKRLQWHSYRNIFLKPNRINGGVAFWQKNKATLEAASIKYGVPEEIIVAIIGVETRYGSNTGSYKVLDSLTTLGFHFPKRARFFKSELEHFLLLCREEGFDPSQPKGSYAGAMGKSQFISSSYRAYAVDGDADGKRDLWISNADIINSIAYYLKLNFPFMIGTCCSLRGCPIFPFRSHRGSPDLILRSSIIFEPYIIYHRINYLKLRFFCLGCICFSLGCHKITTV